MEREPRAEIDSRFSEASEPLPWEHGREALAAAELYWVTTVRTDGRPHVTPLIGVWLDEAMYFCTGPDEQKAKNLAANPACALTTGANRLHGGLDLVVEGRAERVSDEARLRAVAAAYVEKYGEEWRFDAHDGAFHHSDGEGVAHVFELAPAKVLGFGKGPYSQTRWLFS